MAGQNAPKRDPLHSLNRPIVGGAARGVSSWKLYWMTHGPKWVVAGATLLTVVTLTFIGWVIRVSSSYYLTPPTQSPPVSVAVSSSDPRSPVRLKGPIRVELEIESLEYGERTIVSRDLSKILGQVIGAAGHSLSPDGPESIVVRYAEVAGRPIPVQREGTSVRSLAGQESSMRPVRIEVTVHCEADTGGALLLQKAFSARIDKLVIPRQAITRSVGVYKRELYAATYSDMLDHLRQLKLPGV